jgi:acyl dehydratase
MTQKIAYEDFQVGRVIEFGRYAVQREDVLRFAADFDPQRFHLDDAAGEDSLFGGLAASGWHTCAMLMRMVCDEYLVNSTSLGSPGIDHLKWLRPVHPGDTLRARVTVLQTRRMNSKPHIGLVLTKWEALNQHDEVVIQLEGWGMFGLRDPSAQQPQQQQQ